MNQIQELHEEAMDLAGKADITRLRGDLKRANELFWQAYENEAQAARLVLDEPSFEPTRSILYRSAASLALDCNELRESERLIAAGLAGYPPEEIAEELRELFEEVNFRRLKLSAHQAPSLESRERFLSAAGGWEDIVDENFLDEIYQNRKRHTRPEVEL